MPFQQGSPSSYTPDFGGDSDGDGLGVKYTPLNVGENEYQRMTVFVPDPDICGFPEPAAGWPTLFVNTHDAGVTQGPVLTFTEADSALHDVAVQALARGWAVVSYGCFGPEGDGLSEPGEATYDPPDNRLASGLLHYNPPGSGDASGLAYPQDQFPTLFKQAAWAVQYARENATTWALNDEIFFAIGEGGGAWDAAWMALGPDMQDSAMNDLRAYSSHIQFVGLVDPVGTWVTGCAQPMAEMANYFPDISGPVENQATDLADLPETYALESSIMRFAQRDHGLYWSGAPTHAEMLEQWGETACWLWCTEGLQLDALTPPEFMLMQGAGQDRFPSIGLLPPLDGDAQEPDAGINGVLIAQRLREIDGAWSGGFHEQNSELRVSSAALVDLDLVYTTDDVNAPLAPALATDLVTGAALAGSNPSGTYAETFITWAAEQITRINPVWDGDVDDQSAPTMGDVDIDATKLQDVFFYGWEKPATVALNETTPVYLYSPEITASWSLNDPTLYAFELWNGVQFPSATDAVGGAFPNFTTLHEPLWNYMLQKQLRDESAAATTFHDTYSKHVIEGSIQTVMNSLAPASITSLPTQAVNGTAAAVDDQLSWLLDTLIPSTATTMANSYVAYSAAAAQTVFVVTFPAISAGHIYLLLDGVTSTDFTLSSDKLTLTYTGATVLAAGTVVKIYRQTPGNLVDFVDGSVLVEADLDLSVLAARYMVEEAQDGANAAMALETSGAGSWDAVGNRLKNLGAPVLSSDAARLLDIQNAELAAGGGSGLPTVTTADNGSVLMVEAGIWNVGTPAEQNTVLGLGTAALVDTGVDAGDVPALTELASQRDSLPVLDARNLDLRSHSLVRSVPTSVFSFIAAYNGGTPAPGIPRTTSSTWQEGADGRVYLVEDSRRSDPNLLMTPEGLEHWWHDALYAETPVDSGVLGPYGTHNFMELESTSSVGGANDAEYAADCAGYWSTGGIKRFEVVISNATAANGHQYQLELRDSSSAVNSQTFTWSGTTAIVQGTPAGNVTSSGADSLGGGLWSIWIEVTEDGSTAIAGNTCNARIICDVGQVGEITMRVADMRVTDGTGSKEYQRTAICPAHQNEEDGDHYALSLDAGEYEWALTLVFNNTSGTAGATNGLLPQVYLWNEEVSGAVTPYFSSYSPTLLLGDDTGAAQQNRTYQGTFELAAPDYLTVRVANYDSVGTYTASTMVLEEYSYFTIRKVG